MNRIISILVLAIIFTSCSKASFEDEAMETLAVSQPHTSTYTIAKGAHNSDKLEVKPVDAETMRFAVRFDSSAVYSTARRANQRDINKLYGFSDNMAHPDQYSARFGWRWSDGALRLFAFVLNGGQQVERELGQVPVGAWAHCSITVSGKSYLFTLNGVTTALPRTSITAKAQGYQLFPYFGGEVAPQRVRIEIKNI